MLRQSWIWLTRLTLVTLLALIVLLAALLLIGRFWLGTHLDQFRPRIEAALSRQVAVQAHIGHLSVDWHGLLPEFLLRDVRLQDAGGHVDLSLEWISARLAVLPLLAGRVDFARLEIDHPVLRVQRRADGRLLVAGILLPTPSEEPGSPFVDWLLSQSEVRINDGRLEWQDALASGQVLTLPHLQLRLQGQGRRHQFDLAAEAPADLLRGLRVAGVVDAEDSRHLERWSGQIDVRQDFVDVSRLRSYAQAPVDWRSGRGKLALRLRFAAAQVQALEADAHLDAVALTLAPDLPELGFSHLAGHLAYQRLPDGFKLSARQLLAQAATATGLAQDRPADFDLSVDGSGGSAHADVVNLGALAALTESLPLPPELRNALRERAPIGIVRGLQAQWSGSKGVPARFSVRASLSDVALQPVGSQPGVRHLSGSLQADQDSGQITIASDQPALLLPEVFAQPLQLQALQAAVHWTRSGELTRLTLDRLRLDDPDLAGTASGTLEFRGAEPRNARVVGLFDRIELPAVPRFLPLVMSADARHWVATALRAGHVRQARLNLEGDLRDFPFRRPGQGSFAVHLPVDGVRLDFAPGWPLLSGIRGQVDFEGPGLTVHAIEAHQDRLGAHEVVARIANLDADQPVLEAQGVISGPLQAGLDFILASPLKRSLGGFASTFQAQGEGSLNLALQVPLSHADDTRVQGDLMVDAGGLRDPAGTVPPVTALRGHLHFTEHEVGAQGLSARVLGGTAQGALSSGAHGAVQLAVHGQFEGAEVDEFYGRGRLDFVRGNGDWDGHFRFDDQTSTLDIEGHVPVFGALAGFSVRQHEGPLAIEAHGSAACRAVLDEFAPALVATAEGPLDWQIAIRHESGGDRISGTGHCQVLGRTAEAVLSGRTEALTVDINGSLDGAAVHTLWPQLPTGLLTGSTRWAVQVDERPGQPLVRFGSDLRGLRIDLPAPFGKAAADSWALKGSLARLRGSRDLYLSGGVDGLLGVAGLLPAAGSGTVHRLAVHLGGPAVLPGADGLSLSGSLADLDLSAWRSALQGSGARPAAGAAREQTTTLAPPAFPVSADLQIAAMRSGRYRFDAHHWQLRSQPGGWHLQAHGPQIEGEADWNAAGSGRLTARLERLLLAGEESTTADSPPSEGQAGRRLPAVDLQVRDFQLDHRMLGRLELRGEPEADGWQISHFGLSQTHGKLDAAGHWIDRPGHSQTRLDAVLEAPDTGALLQALGYAKVLTRGKTRLQASLDWPGDPEDFSSARLGGSLDLDSQAGQFLSVEPGVGRLLGLLSLQALPRRVTLDFRDIFSQGFAFDSIKGHFDIERGTLRTRNLEMAGPAALVRLGGTVGLASESQDLDVRVSPAVGDGLSIATTVLTGPVVGAATYLVQKLLRNPIDKILTYEYRVTGSWDDPQVARVARAATPPAPGETGASQGVVP